MVEPEFKCPKVRFGRTEIQMPIITCGGMRMQQTWAPSADFTMDSVDPECQKNFVSIIEKSLELGINHFETAKGYGCSELQYGEALKSFPREKLIIQTKVSPFPDPEDFRKALNESFEKLQLDGDDGYIDLFAFHGINFKKKLDWVQNGCMAVVDEFRQAGKIKHVGFSSHAPVSVIKEAIETNLFDYVNLHFQFIGSYTASGTGSTHMGNLECIEAANKLDMGVFIISPYDKGGMLYKPSVKFADACKPYTPIELQNLWSWTYPTSIHTLVTGAARPSDFFEHIASAKLLTDDRKTVETNVKMIEERLREMEKTAMGEDFYDSWWKNVPTMYETPTGIAIGQIIWIWILLKTYGLYDYCRARYKVLEENRDKWNKEVSPEENKNTIPFDWCPGLSYHPDDDDALIKDLAGSSHKDKIISVLKECHEWIARENIDKMKDQLTDLGWKPAFDLQPDIPWPERPAS